MVSKWLGTLITGHRTAGFAQDFGRDQEREDPAAVEQPRDSLFSQGRRQFTRRRRNRRDGARARVESVEGKRECGGKGPLSSPIRTHFRSLYCESTHFLAAEFNASEQPDQPRRERGHNVSATYTQNQHVSICCSVLSETHFSSAGRTSSRLRLEASCEFCSSPSATSSRPTSPREGTYVDSLAGCSFVPFANTY